MLFTGTSLCGMQFMAKVDIAHRRITMLTHVGTQTIETARLLLRPFAYADGASMLKNWVADERVLFMYAEPVYITEAAV